MKKIQPWAFALFPLLISLILLVVAFAVLAIFRLAGRWAR
jgi:hypothetical protein